MPEIPYERQSDTESSRTCGAACLSMAYRSFGKQVAQSEIWQSVAKPNRFGVVSSTTHLMVQDALSRGFKAVAIQARYPIHDLRLCHEAGVRVILNHRLDREVTTGHFSLLAGIDHESVLLHDPLLGPSRRLSHAELLELWMPYFSGSEIAGNFMIAVSGEAGPQPVCEFCHAPIPVEVECPRCRAMVGLEPAAPLGCVTYRCIARGWNYVCCPACDYTWNFAPDPLEAQAESQSVPSPAPKTASAQSIPATKRPEPDFNRLFAALDQFTSLLSSSPAVAADARVQNQLNFIKASKEGVISAHAESVAYQKVRQAQVDALGAATREKSERQRAKMEEMSKPLPALDGEALARALLRNLGFISGSR